MFGRPSQWVKIGREDLSEGLEGSVASAESGLQAFPKGRKGLGGTGGVGRPSRRAVRDWESSQEGLEL